MESQQLGEQSFPPPVTSNQNSTSPRQDASVETQSMSGISSWARNLKFPQSSGQEDLQSGNAGKSTFSRITSFGFRLSPKSSQSEEVVAEGSSTTTQPGVLGSLTKGFVDTSRSAVKAVQRYVKYFERILTYFNGENQPGRR
ncbi:hypothetical protein BHE74_00048016 [Ensete ventricosum]|nr:hypothetical protein BHE74_00048016 [Ensete ventricosum]